MEFLVNDPAAMTSETLEVNLYNDKKVGRRSTFLGKVRISGSSFAAAGAESLVYYPLEKRSVFSQIKGELGLKVCFVDDEPSPVVGDGGGGGDGEVKEKEKEKEKGAAEGSDEKSKDDAKAGESKTEDTDKKSPPVADPPPTGYGCWRAQVLLGDLAAQGERVEALLNLRDRRSTSIFVAFCLVASLIFYVLPTRVLVLGWGFYYLRHPRFRGDMPSVPVNFFRRLPSRADRIL